MGRHAAFLGVGAGLRLGVLRPHGLLSSAKGGTGSYKWNGAGLLNAYSARGIRKTYYNESGQPESIEFTDKGHLDYTYSTSGARTARLAGHP